MKDVALRKGNKAVVNAGHRQHQKRKAPRKGPVQAEQQTPSDKHPHGSAESCAIPEARG